MFHLKAKRPTEVYQVFPKSVCMCVCVYIHYINMSLKLFSFNAFFKKPGELTYISPNSYAPPQRVGFLRRCGLKTGIGLPILVWSRVWFSRDLRECMKVFIVSMPNEYPGKSWKWILKKSFCLLF